MFNYGNTGLSRYAEGGVVPEELTPEGGVGDLFTTMQAAPEERFYFSAPRQQADGGYGNTGYNPNQNGYRIPPPMNRPMPMPTPMPGDVVMPPEYYNKPGEAMPSPGELMPGEFTDFPPMDNMGRLIPDWMIGSPKGAITTQALVEHTNPVTGEKFTAPNGGYSINPAYIESQLNNQYVENLGRDIGAPGLEFYQDELNKNMQDASTGKSFDQIVADLDYSGEGQAYVSPAETEAARVQAQTNNLMGAYQSNLGRDIGSEGLSFYSNQLDQYNADPSTGKSMDQIMADLRYSSEGQSYTPPAQMMPSMINGGGNARDDANMVAAHQANLDADSARRTADRTNRGPGGEFTLPPPNNLDYMLTGLQDGLGRFGNDLNTGIGNYIESGGIGGAFTKGLNNIFGGGNGADDAKQVAQAQANANAAAAAATGTRYGSGHPSANAASAAASNAGGIYKYGIGGLVSPYGHRR